MRTREYHTIKRTDMWAEGKWLDLWSVVHFLTGISIGFGLYILHFRGFPTFAFTLMLLIAYEMWEALVHIEETPTNRCMDVVVGIGSFTPTFFLIAPLFSTVILVVVFGIVLGVTCVCSVSGWKASQKATLFEKHMRTRYLLERALFKERRLRFKQRLVQKSRDKKL